MSSNDEQIIEIARGIWASDEGVTNALNLEEFANRTFRDDPQGKLAFVHEHAFLVGVVMALKLMEQAHGQNQVIH